MRARVVLWSLVIGGLLVVGRCHSNKSETMIPEAIVEPAVEEAEPKDPAINTDKAVAIDHPQTNNTIASYDGIPLGSTIAETEQYLAKLAGIKTVYNGTPHLYRVPSKSYYAYNISRDRGVTDSEVTVYFRNGQIQMFKDVFNGKLFDDNNSALSSFKSMRTKLTEEYGRPDFESRTRVSWIMDDAEKHLTIELPSDNYGLPIVKIVTWAN